MDKNKIAVILLSFMIIFACEDQIISDCDLGEIENINAMSAQFNAIQERIFDVRCTTCHSGSVPSGGVDLSPNNAYSELINKNIVIPGNSSSSSLYNRLNTNDQNKVMPPSGKITQVLIDSVAAWIDKGALNN